MVVGIIGILAAVAIPAYQTYTNNAKRGVTESALRSAARMVRMNQSSLSLTEEDDLEEIESKGKAIDFKIHGAAATKIEAGDDDWCISVVVTDGWDYVSCINQAGEIQYGDTTKTNTTPNKKTCSSNTGATMGTCT